MIRLKKLLILLPFICLASIFYLFYKTTSLPAKVEEKTPAANPSVKQIAEPVVQSNAELQVGEKQTSNPVLRKGDNYYLPAAPILAYHPSTELAYDPILQVATATVDKETLHFPQSRESGYQNMLEALKTDSIEQEQVIPYENKLYATADFLKQFDIPIAKQEQDDELLFILDIPEEKADLPLDVPLIEQMAAPRLYNGCEVTSMAMILNYHGVNVTKNELAENVSVVPLTYESGLKGNPNDGFVGNMADGPGLGVYHGPMLDLAKQYVGDRAVDLTGSSPDAIYQSLDEGLPVWVITTSSFAPVGGFETWQTPSGEVEVTFSLHSVAVTGYDDESVYINDPYGGKNKPVGRDNFEKAWEQMGSQAIVIKE